MNEVLWSKVQELKKGTIQVSNLQGAFPSAVLKQLEIVFDRNDLTKIQAKTINSLDANWPR